MPKTIWTEHLLFSSSETSPHQNTKRQKDDAHTPLFFLYDNMLSTAAIRVIAWLEPHRARAEQKRRAKRAKQMKIHVASNSTDFDQCIEAYEENFLRGRELNSQVTCIINGKVVLQIHGSRDSSSKFNDDSTVVVFSSGKVLESAALAMLVDRHQMDYSDPIAKHWPEYGEVFSSKTTVAQLMQHRAGLAKIHTPFTTTKQALDTFSNVAKLEEWLFNSLKLDSETQENESFYHAITRGLLLDLLVFKVDGRRLHDFIREEICIKLGLEDCVSLGCATPEHFARMAQCENMNSMAWDLCRLGGDKVLRSVYFETLGEDEYNYWYYQPREISSNLNLVTSAEMRKMFVLTKDKGVQPDLLANCRTFSQIPVSSMNFVASAYGLARISQELANNGGVLLSKRGMQLALATDGAMFDKPTQASICFTNCGWSKDFFRKDWVGWSGVGGSLNVFSVKYNASFAYVPTKLESRMHCSNALRILDEFIKVLESRSNALQTL